MNFPNSTSRDLARQHHLKFEADFMNSSGEQIAGIWFIDGAWKISTSPLFRFSTKSNALAAWATHFNHQTGLPLRCPRETVPEDEKRAAVGGEIQLGRLQNCHA